MGKLSALMPPLPASPRLVAVATDADAFPGLNVEDQGIGIGSVDVFGSLRQFCRLATYWIGLAPSGLNLLSGPRR